MPPRRLRVVFDPADERLIDTRGVLARIPVHRSTLNAMIKDGRFPPPLHISPSKLVWRLSAILAWLDERERHPIARRAYALKPRKRRR